MKRLFCSLQAIVFASSLALAIGLPSDMRGEVAFTIDATGGGTPISPNIYGVNGNLRPSGVASLRLGGNRWTGYNWETNSSNAGFDFQHYSDLNLVGFQPNTPPGQAVLPTLQEGAGRGAAVNVTVPIAGYVAADNNQEVFVGQTAPSSRWHEVVARKSTIYPDSSLGGAPNEADGFVFTDEFVHWVESNRQSGREVLYTLDNEPGLWDFTHPRLYGPTNPTFADVGAKSIAHASAIKDVAPDAPVLGGVTFGWSGMVNLDNAPDFNSQVPQPRDPQGLHFNRWLLETMAAEEQSQGRVLMDVLDLHWYPEARGGGQRITFGGELNNSPAVVAARLQAPRSLWDPDYTEESWITQFSTNGDPIRLLDRVQADIDELKPGTAISVSEYNYGGGNHISGGIAQADVLGIFGREGVFNASWWPVESGGNRAFTEAGFEMFTDFDGAGGRFGDLSIDAVADDNGASSVYASLSTDGDGEMIVVAINKTATPMDATIAITSDQRYTDAEVFQLTDSSAQPVRAGDLAIGGGNSFVYEMPAYSVSTLRLTVGDLVGDFNGDGLVNAVDYGVWRDTRFSTTDLRADANGNGFIDGNDITFWASSYGANSLATASIPEPTGLAVTASFLAAAVCVVRGRR
ncbi:MAG: glycoside hydrolase family 44 protein [Planctomycetota bacterium]